MKRVLVIGFAILAVAATVNAAPVYLNCVAGNEKKGTDSFTVRVHETEGKVTIVESSFVRSFGEVKGVFLPDLVRLEYFQILDGIASTRGYEISRSTLLVKGSFAEYETAGYFSGRVKLNEMKPRSGFIILRGKCVLVETPSGASSSLFSYCRQGFTASQKTLHSCDNIIFVLKRNIRRKQ